MEETTSGGKLKSRKFWVTVAVCAYFAIMAIKEQGMDNPVTQAIYIAGIVIIVAVWFWGNYKVKSDKIYAESDEIEEDEDEEVQG